jgi:hypothetical protein
MSAMYIFFWKSFKKLVFMLNWKSVDSINLRWNSWVILFLEMAFTWIFIRFKPLWIGLPQLLFGMFNVFLSSPIFIGDSITHYSMIVIPFIHLIWKDQTFSWRVEAENAFQYLKVFFMIAPFFIHVDPSKLFVLEMDTSDFALGVVFSQVGIDNLHHLVGFRFCKFFPVKINYEIHDKKILAIMDAFEEWCHLFQGLQHEITVYSYHKNFLTFHDGWCVESMSSSMGIILVPISVHDYLLSKTTTRGTRCVIPLLVPHA